MKAYKVNVTELRHGQMGFIASNDEEAIAHACAIIDDNASKDSGIKNIVWYDRETTDVTIVDSRKL